MNRTPTRWETLCQIRDRGTTGVSVMELADLWDAPTLWVRDLACKLEAATLVVYDRERDRVASAEWLERS